jgi:hypothetical protein
MRKTSKKQRKEHGVDDPIAEQQFAIARYFASGLIAGGSGVILAMLLSGINIKPASFIALGILDLLLTIGCIYFYFDAVKWMGIKVSKIVYVFAYGGITYQALTSLIAHPQHTIIAFTDYWWSLFVRAVITVIIGCFFRFSAELEIDDLQYGLDHDMAAISKPSKVK